MKAQSDAICSRQHCACWERREEAHQDNTVRPGVSIPAVTTRLERTKQDMRKGRRTGLPVSVDPVSSHSPHTPILLRNPSSSTRMQCRIHNLLGLPYLGCHLIDLARLVRHDGILCSLESLFAHQERPRRKAKSRSANKVSILALYLSLFLYHVPSGQNEMWIMSEQRMAAYCDCRDHLLYPAVPFWTVLSPRIGYASSLPDAAPVRTEVILGLRQLAIAWERGRHSSRRVCLVGKGVTR